MYTLRNDRSIKMKKKLTEVTTDTIYSNFNPEELTRYHWSKYDTIQPYVF